MDCLLLIIEGKEGFLISHKFRLDDSKTLTKEIQNNFKKDQTLKVNIYGRDNYIDFNQSVEIDQFEFFLNNFLNNKNNIVIDGREVSSTPLMDLVKSYYEKYDEDFKIENTLENSKKTYDNLSIIVKALKNSNRIIEVNYYPILFQENVKIAFNKDLNKGFWLTSLPNSKYLEYIRSSRENETFFTKKPICNLKYENEYNYSSEDSDSEDYISDLRMKRKSIIIKPKFLQENFF